MAGSIITKTVVVQVVTDTQITQAVIPMSSKGDNLPRTLREELHRKIDEIADQIGSLR